MIAILAHGRQVEWTARLDFLWQLQASHEKREMAVLQESNKRILYNLLPAHVAAHFLDNQFRNNMVIFSFYILDVSHYLCCVGFPLIYLRFMFTNMVFIHYHNLFHIYISAALRALSLSLPLFHIYVSQRFALLAVVSRSRSFFRCLPGAPLSVDWIVLTHFRAPWDRICTIRATPRWV